MSTRKKPYTLTDEHRAQLAPWAQRWIDNALRVEPQTDADRGAMRTAMRGMYTAAKLTPPTEHREIFVASPISGAIAANIASCVWWLRRNPQRHAELFGRVISEQEIMAGALAAAGRAVAIGRAELFGEPLELAPLPRADAAIYAATDAATRAAGGSIVRFYLSALTFWERLRNGGNQWSGWAAYISFFRHVSKLEIDYSRWAHYEAAAIHGGPRFMHADFWIVSDFPTVVKRDERNLPHCATGPALAWRDGWALYFWHGVRVPRQWIESPKTLDPRIALTHENAEMRRCAAEIIGWDRVIAALDPITIDVDPDPQIGTLVEVTLDGERERFLRVKCGTGRMFALPVPPDMRTALQANAWTYALDGDVLRGLEART